MRHYIILLLLYLGGNLFGQTNHNIDITYGFGRSNITGHTILDDRYESLQANSLNFLYQFGLSTKFLICSGISLEQRGGRFTSFEREILGETPPLMLGDTVLRSNKNEFAYLAIPLNFKYRLYPFQNFEFSISAGGYYNFLLKQLWNFDNSNRITLIEDGILQHNYTSNDYGLSAGLGVSYHVSKNFGLTLDYQFQKGLKDVFKDEDIEGFHIRNAVDFGIRIRIRGKEN